MSANHSTHYCNPGETDCYKEDDASDDVVSGTQGAIFKIISLMHHFSCYCRVYLIKLDREYQHGE